MNAYVCRQRTNCCCNVSVKLSCDSLDSGYPGKNRESLLAWCADVEGCAKGGCEPRTNLLRVRHVAVRHVHLRWVAAAPSGVEHAGRQSLWVGIVVGDHQPGPMQAAAGQWAQEVKPEGIGFRGAEAHAQHIPPAVSVDARGDDHPRRDDAALLADLDVCGVGPDRGTVALDQTVEEGGDLVVDGPHSRDTWLLEMPAKPIVLARSSTERGDTLDVGIPFLTRL